jgi:hypothetical protein
VTRADANGGEAGVSLILFKKKNFGGESHHVTKSHGNLRVTPVGYRTRSLMMSSGDDRALVFSKKMYRGKVAFIRGIQDVPDSADTFFKPLRAVRVDSFRLYLNVTVVCSDGDFPGSWTGRQDAIASIDAAIDWANRIWGRGMLWLERRKTEVHDAPRTFELKWPFPKIPPQWKQPGIIDVVFVNRIGRRNTVARRYPPLIGTTICVGRVVKRGEVKDELMGYSLAHELGHYLGIEHPSSRDDPRNLMCRGNPVSLDPENIQLLQGQIERVHQVLAAHAGRKVERHN